jgi:FG-GAP-like repeat
LEGCAKNKLFGVDNPKNTFTETEEVLMETSSVSSAINSEPTISSNLTLSSNNTISSSSFVNNNTLTPSSISSNISIDSSFSSNVSNLNSSKSISFLEVLLGSIKVSAAESDYSWPWKFGETWNVNSGSNYQPRSGYVSNKWHAKVASEENETTNRGLDIMVPGSYWNSQNGNWNDIPVFAPKTGTITQLCTKNGTGGDNYFVRVDDMYIWHMTPQNFILNTSVKKGQQIGTVAIGSNRSGNIGQTGDYTTKCGSGIGAHLHIKFMLNNMNVDGTTMTWENDNYSSFTSQNSNNTTQNVLFRDANSGGNSIWKFNNTTHTGDAAFPNSVGTDWKVAGFGDFNGDGYQDILWRNSNTGQNVLWEMQNGVISKDWGVISTVGTDFAISGIGDFNGDTFADILWRNSAGVNVIWNYKRNEKIGDTGAFSVVPTDWNIVSVADFNNDGKADIFWRNNNGSNVIWNMNNRYIAASTAFNSVGNDFVVGGLGDFNQDGKADIFWRNQNGYQNVIWNMNNAVVSTSTAVGSTGGNSVQVKGIFAK